MSAKEMFEKLGFNGIETDYSLIYRYMGTKANYQCELYFYLTLKEYVVGVDDECISIDMRLHKAINKQLEELGWL